MCFGKILAIGALPLVEIRHRIQPHSVNTHTEPKINHRTQTASYVGTLKIQIRLVMIEPVPVVLICDGIPGPVGRLEVFEDDPRVPVLLARVAPYIKVARRTARPRAPRALKPG